MRASSLALPFALSSALMIYAGGAPVVQGASANEIIEGPVHARIIKVRDGDSVDVVAHVWPGHDVRVSVRLRGIDAPEMKARCQQEKDRALAARNRLTDLVSSGRVRLFGISGGKYFGRVLARVETETGDDVQKILLRENLVRPYAGKRRHGWCLHDS